MAGGCGWLPMTRSLDCACTGSMLCELLAEQIRVELSSIATEEMVRLPSPVPAGGRDRRSSISIGVVCPLPWSVAQVKVGGGNPVA